MKKFDLLDNFRVGDYVNNPGLSVAINIDMMEAELQLPQPSSVNSRIRYQQSVRGVVVVVRASSHINGA